MKDRASRACAFAGVLLMALATLLPDAWHPEVPLFAGLALVAFSHVLTPCRDQITQWWRQRISRP
jgi:hypothetical protein